GSVGNALQPLEWSSSGWQLSNTPAVDDGSFPIDVWALDANDVWLAGVLDGGKGMVMHWDGTAWATPTVLPNSYMLTSVWADRDDDVWVAGRGDPSSIYGDSCVVYHFDGTRWSNIPMPSHPPYAEKPALFGLGPDAVWITTEITHGTDYRAVWKWDGNS